MERHSRRHLFHILASVVLFLGYGIEAAIRLFDYLAPAPPVPPRQPRHYTLTAQTGRFVLTGYAVQMRVTRGDER
jgi:hypothetical protein